MSYFKKLTACLCSAVLLTTAGIGYLPAEAARYAAAEDTFGKHPATAFHGESVKALPGETVDFSISISNPDGYASCGVTLTYDAALTPVMRNEDTPYFEAGDGAKGLIMFSRVYPDEYRFAFGTMGTENCTESGTFVTVRFTVPEDAEAGTSYSLNILPDSVKDTSLNTRECIFDSGSITVAEPETEPLPTTTEPAPTTDFNPSTTPIPTTSEPIPTTSEPIPTTDLVIPTTDFHPTTKPIPTTTPTTPTTTIYIPTTDFHPTTKPIPTTTPTTPTTTSDEPTTKPTTPTTFNHNITTTPTTPTTTGVPTKTVALFSVGKAEAYPGDTVPLKIKISADEPVSAFSIILNYDCRLTLVMEDEETPKYDISNKFNCTSYNLGNDYEDGYGRISCMGISVSGSKDETLTFYFTVPADASSKDSFTVKVDVKEAGINGKNVPTTAESGKITVLEKKKDVTTTPTTPTTFNHNITTTHTVPTTDQKNDVTTSRTTNDTNHITYTSTTTNSGKGSTTTTRNAETKTTTTAQPDATDTETVVVTTTEKPVPDDMIALIFCRQDQDGNALKDGVLMLQGTAPDGSDVTFSSKNIAFAGKNQIISGSGSSLIWLTGKEDPKFLLPDGTYTLTEKTAPTGAEPAAKMTFIIVGSTLISVNDGKVADHTHIIMKSSLTETTAPVNGTTTADEQKNTTTTSTSVSRVTNTETMPSGTTSQTSSTQAVPGLDEKDLPTTVLLTSTTDTTTSTTTTTTTTDATPATSTSTTSATTTTSSTTTTTTTTTSTILTTTTTTSTTTTTTTSSTTTTTATDAASTTTTTTTTATDPVISTTTASQTKLQDQTTTSTARSTTDSTTASQTTQTLPVTSTVTLTTFWDGDGTGPITSGTTSVTTGETTTEPIQTTTTEEPFVPVRQSYEFGVHNWGFNNTAKIFGIRQNDNSPLFYNLTDAHKQLLYSKLSNVEIAKIENVLSKKTQGACFGMAATSILNSYGYFDLDDLGIEGRFLSDVTAAKANQETISAINYYHMLQFTKVVSQEVFQMQRMDDQQKLTRLINELNAGNPVLVGYNYTLNDEDNTPYGHAVVAYKAEKKQQVVKFDDGDVKTYDTEIFVYENKDNSNSSRFNILIDTQNWYWCIKTTAIPEDVASSAITNHIFKQAADKDGVQKINRHHRGNITLLLSDPELLNFHGYFHGNETYQAETYPIYYAQLTMSPITETSYHISTAADPYDGEFHGDPDDGDIQLTAAFNDFYFFEDADPEQTNIASMSADRSYNLDPNDPTRINLSMEYRDCMLKAAAEKAGKVTVSPKYRVACKNVTGNYLLSMILDASAMETDWHEIAISGKGSDDEILLTAYSKGDQKGWLVSGTSLKNIQVRANNYKDSAERTFSANAKEVLLYEIDVHTIGAALDLDKDGIFETEIPMNDNLAKGDLDGDGEVTVVDAQTLLQAYAEVVAGNDSPLTDAQNKAGDVNGDGTADVTDAQFILNYYTQNTLAGVETSWEDITKQ